MTWLVAYNSEATLLYNDKQTTSFLTVSVSYL